MLFATTTSRCRLRNATRYYFAIFFFLMTRRPPRSTLFPTRRSSDLVCERGHAGGTRNGGRFCDHRRVLPRASVLPDWALRLHWRSEEHTSELQSRSDLVCRLLLEKKNAQG